MSKFDDYSKKLSPPDELYAVLPPFPVSVNSLYHPGFRGKMVLSKEGKEYKAAAINSLKDAWLFDLTRFKRHKFAKYRLVILMWLPRSGVGGVYTSGFPKTAKEPVRQMDVSNGIKIVEDVVAAVTGIDDRYNFWVVVGKEAAERDGEEKTEVWLEILEPIAVH